jgi:hypothetical protein
VVDSVDSPPAANEETEAGGKGNWFDTKQIWMKQMMWINESPNKGDKAMWIKNDKDDKDDKHDTNNKDKNNKNDKNNTPDNSGIKKRAWRLTWQDSGDELTGIKKRSGSSGVSKSLWSPGFTKSDFNDLAFSEGDAGDEDSQPR